VKLDNRGRYRARVRSYTHAIMVAAGQDEPVMWFDGADLEFRVSHVRPLVMRWWRDHAVEFRRYFPNSSGPMLESAAQWLGARLRETGAEISTCGASSNRRKIATWSTVDHAAMAYGERLISSLEQRDKEKEKIQWEKDFLTK